MNRSDRRRVGKCPEKFALARTPTPARETRALPRTEAAHVYEVSSIRPVRDTLRFFKLMQRYRKL